jgi:predicted kinase
MVGEPGSGKSYFARHILNDGECVRYISRDDVRNSMVRSNEEFFSKEKLVFKEFVKQIIDCLDNEDEYITDVIADATHLNWSSRSKLLSALGILSGERDWINVIPVVMTTPLNESIRRNNTRNGRACVPEVTLRKMASSRTHPRQDPFHYTAIMEV